MAIKTAIIGLGIMGRRMAEHMHSHPDFELAQIWDPDPAACAAAGALVPGLEVARTAEAAMAQADLVYLACPPEPRKAYAEHAAKAGRAVFLEKPLGVDDAASRDLVATLERSGVPAAVNFTQAAGAAMTEVALAARSGTLGALVGADIIVTYQDWPRAWQRSADWLRFRAEGGMTREVISHFLFFAERILGPLSLIWARPSYPDDPALCETHMLARLENAAGCPVTVMASVGGAQPDRQELTIKGTQASRRISEFYKLAGSSGDGFTPIGTEPRDPRAASLGAQLDALSRCVAGQPNALATPREALRVQHLIEAMLRGAG